VWNQGSVAISPNAARSFRRLEVGGGDPSHNAASSEPLPKASLRDNCGGLGELLGVESGICTLPPNASRSFRRLEVGGGDSSHNAASLGPLPKASLRDNCGGLGELLGVESGICTLPPNAARSFRRLEVGGGDPSHNAVSSGPLPKASPRDNRGGLGELLGVESGICTLPPNASRSFRRLEVGGGDSSHNAASVGPLPKASLRDNCGGLGELLGVESGICCHISQRCKVFQTLGGWGW